MELLLIRAIYTEKSTGGSLYIDDQFECYTLEDKVREVTGQPVEQWKIKGQTAIPAGRYEVKLLLSPRFGFVTPHVLNVPGFTDIEIHPGNTAADTEGCILVGTQREDNMITNSRLAFTDLAGKLTTLGGAGIWLTVV